MLYRSANLAAIGAGLVIGFWIGTNYSNQRLQQLLERLEARIGSQETTTSPVGVDPTGDSSQGEAT